MSLQNLELPPFAVTELYKDFLVDVKSGEQYATLPALSAEVIEPVTVTSRERTPEKPVTVQAEKPAVASQEKLTVTQVAPQATPTETQRGRITGKPFLKVTFCSAQSKRWKPSKRMWKTRRKARKEQSSSPVLNSAGLME